MIYINQIGVDDMKISIRQGVFETNSSSMHSLCILNHSDKNIDTYTNKIDKNGIWKIDILSYLLFTV